MRKSLQKKYECFEPEQLKDSEGSRTITYKKVGEIQLVIWPASGKIQAEMYGERLKYILNAECAAEDTLKEGNAVRVYGTQKADYRVISSKLYSSIRRMELERIT